MRTLGVKAASKVRRKMLGLLMRLPGANNSDPAALLARFPDEALVPLRRAALDPVPELLELAAREPVSRLKMPLGLRGWLVTGYDEARTVLAADHRTFSNDFGNMVGKIGIAAEQDPGGLGFADPPDHTRLRHMLTPHFTTRALSRRLPRIEQIVDEALADTARLGAGGEPVDLLSSFAFPIASRTIMEILGVGDEDREAFRRLSTARFDLSGVAADTLDVIGEAVDLLVPVVARQRTQPQDGLIGHILAEYGDDISDVELAGLADGVLTGGLETTVSMITLGALVMLNDSSAFDAMRDEAGVDDFVEELLRYLTVVQVGFPRFAVRDSTVGGKAIFAGDIVICSLSGANRDVRRGADLDTADPHREPAGHLAFGHGIHRCVGAELARMELRLAYPALAKAFPAMRLAVAADELAYRDLSVVYGLHSLPVLLS